MSDTNNSENSMDMPNPEPRNPQPPEVQAVDPTTMEAIGQAGLTADDIIAAHEQAAPVPIDEHASMVRDLHNRLTSVEELVSNMRSVITRVETFFEQMGSTAPKT